ncbi:MAG: AraC family transcriptional regulator [Myxococcota bacterium]
MLHVFGDLGTDDVDVMSAAIHAVPRREGGAFLVADFAAVGGDGIRFAVGQAAITALEARTGLVARADDPDPVAPWRVAVVRPDGIAGMLFVGFDAMLGGRFPIAIYDARESAVATLPEPIRGEVQTTFDLADRRAGAQAWRVVIRRALMADPTLSAGAVAARVGWSERTLQRRLEADGASYREERQRARMEIAIELLTVGHDKVGAVAKATGFASESQFCHAFRAYTGHTPTALRERMTGLSWGDAAAVLAS